MVDMLKKNPVVTAEVVLGRLTQKVEEWEADKRKMTEVWQKMYDANYHKSLDHRSFYFKQVRFLSTLVQNTPKSSLRGFVHGPLPYLQSGDAVISLPHIPHDLPQNAV